MVAGERIAIWGTGSLAKKIYALYCNQVDVVCFFDSDESKEGQKIGNLPIKKWEGYCDCKIVIASTYWREIVTKLNKSDFVINGGEYILSNLYFENFSQVTYYELKDFLKLSNKTDYKEIITGRKIAIIYGNCQAGVIEEIMKLYPDFMSDYMLVRTPRVYEWFADKDRMSEFVDDDEFWQSIDLFIYQTVAKDNRFSPKLATQPIVEKLSQACKKINILNLYFTGYFPQAIRNDNIILKNLHSAGLFSFRDKYVDALIEEGLSTEEIIEMISSEEFISDKDIKEYANESLDELKRREIYVDVKIVDYIEDNLMNEQLFYSNNHPCEKLLVEYVNRIMDYLGKYKRQIISPNDVILNVGSLKGEDVPIYPSVARYYKINNVESRFFISRALYSNMLLDFKQYMRVYVEVVRNQKTLEKI